MCVRLFSHGQITQSSKFATFLKYLKKEVIKRSDFLHADEHEGPLQIYIMIFDGEWTSIPKISKIESLQCLYYNNISTT